MQEQFNKSNVFFKTCGITPAYAGTILNDPLFFNDPFLEILEIYSL